jgi:hypothetical protein
MCGTTFNTESTHKSNIYRLFNALVIAEQAGGISASAQRILRDNKAEESILPVVFYF